MFPGKARLLAIGARRWPRGAVMGLLALAGLAVSPANSQALASRAHDIELHGDCSEVMGDGRAVLRDLKSGVNYGASDPREDGEAIPQPESPASP